MQSKECFKCQKIKNLLEFYKHSEMGDGHLNKCIECTKIDVKENYYKRFENKRQYEKIRYQKRKQYASERDKIHRLRNPEKYKARTAVNNAVRDKRIVKKPCEVCGEVNVQAHHGDYSQPLTVRWLCRKCHWTEHNPTRQIIKF